MPEPDFTNFETNEAESNAELAEYVIQIQQQVESPREDDETGWQSRLSCTITHSTPDVVHAAKIALKTLYGKPEWLGCPNYPCIKSNCPKLHMEGDDWKNCGGEVFQIYRAAGAGNVKVGDTVGLYTGDGKWFSTWGIPAGKSVCPGTPTIKYGFAARDKWYGCAGEVFQIYARRKHYRETIQDHDDIALYYVREKKWVSFVETNLNLNTCLGEIRPPPPDRYDECFGNVAELWVG